MEGKDVVPATDSHSPVDTVFYDHLVHPYAVLYPVEFPLVPYDVIVSHRPFCPDREDPVGSTFPAFTWRASRTPGFYGNLRL
jgi:hypothetical protein